MMRLFLIIIFLISPGAALSLEDSVKLHLDAATSLYLTDTCLFDGSTPDRTLLTRIRPYLTATPSRSIFISFAYELNLIASNTLSASQGQAGENTRLRLADIPREVYDDEERALAQNLDRVFLTWYGDGVEASLGRQPIGHGSARVFNTSDIFAPFTPQSTYSEYKAGVDAVRVRKYFGIDGAVELISTAHRDGAEDGYYLLRGEYSLPAVNLSAYGGFTLGAPTFAVDIASDLGNTGIYGECVLRTDSPVQDALRATAGGHRRFLNGVNALAELHYNGVGEESPEKYFLATSTREWINRESFLLGRWYMALSGDYQPHPLVTVGANFIGNLADGSALFQPSVKWAAFESGDSTVTLIGGGSFAMASGDGEFDNSPGTIYFEAQLSL